MVNGGFTRLPVEEMYTLNADLAGFRPTFEGGGKRTVRSMSTVLGAIWTNRQIPKTFWLCSSSFIPGKGRSRSPASMGLDVDAMAVGRGRGDSMMETAA